MLLDLAPYDIDTYGTRHLYRTVKATGDLRPVWAYKNAKKWGVEYEPFLELCKHNCPLCGSKLEYGVGSNLLEDRRDVATPSTDHKIPKTHGGLNEISNFWVICYRCNTLKNNSTAQDILRYENLVRFLKNEPLITFDARDTMRDTTTDG